MINRQIYMEIVIKNNKDNNIRIIIIKIEKIKIKVINKLINYKY
jgi:hypothetical protein